jgi:5-dehydro-2-deoxygluconokinase
MPGSTPAGPFILAMDHQSSFSRVIGGSWPPSAADELLIAREKAELAGVVANVLSVTTLSPLSCGVLVDSRFGLQASDTARQAGMGVIASVEKPGDGYFDLLYGSYFAAYVRRLQATGVKVKLLNGTRWDRPRGVRGITLLSFLHAWCSENSVELLVEIVEPPETPVRAEETLATARTLYAAGIAPDVWKLEPLIQAETVDALSAAALEAGFVPARCVVLGGSLTFEELLSNVARLAAAGVIDGFAVGRALWAGPLMERLTGAQSLAGTERELRERFLSLVELFV